MNRRQHRGSSAGPDLSLMRAMAGVFLIGLVAAALGIGVRATFGAHVAVDETQYALTALSLAEDRSLDISDELAAERWRAFADVEPPRQTEILADGRQISPHDPLLPAVLAIPMGAGGWVAAKLVLAALAGALAALTVWVGVRRFGIPLRIVTVGAVLAAASAPLAVYGQQIYPELPAAALTLAGVAVLTGPLRMRNLVIAGLAVAALPWLSVKYVPVAGVLALFAAVRWWRGGRGREAAGFVGVLAVLGLGYLGMHRLVWGGWTVYASGDHFQESGEFGAVGFDPNYVGRGLRLVGLLVDREYGIATWQPGWLLVLPAIAWLLWDEGARVTKGSSDGALHSSKVRKKGPMSLPAIGLWLPLIVGWLVATFIAVTMHGYWWPGRQLVVVLPLALLVVLRWLAAAGSRMLSVALGLGIAGVYSYACLLIDGYAGEITWVSGFHRVDNALYRAYDALLPDYRGEFWVQHVAWIGVFAALLALGVRTARRGASHECAVQSNQRGMNVPLARIFRANGTFIPSGLVSRRKDQQDDQECSQEGGDGRRQSDHRRHACRGRLQ